MNTKPANCRCLLPLAVLLLSLSFTAQAQWVTIPDTAFAHFLRVKFPACMNADQMDTTCAGIVNARTVNCKSKLIQDMTGISYFDNLDSLIASGNRFSTLPRLPQTLKYLDCGYNNYLTSFPAMPNSLKHFVLLYNSGVTSLPAFPPGLLKLDCQLTSIDTLAPLPASLRHLTMTHCRITSIPSPLPAGLRSLRCWGTPITALPALPPVLNTLSCESNSITAIPTLPDSMEFLKFHHNQVTSIPALPAAVRTLDCGYNPVTVLPVLPPNLGYLNINHTSISILPAALPTGLVSLECAGAPISSLPPLPATLQYLDCGNNPLITSLPELPMLLDLTINDMPNLHCLPRLSVSRLFKFDTTAIKCLPNYPAATTSVPPLTAVPLCDIFNTNGCAVYWNISGKAYHDLNGNCTADSSDQMLVNMKVQLLQNGMLVQQTHTNAGGMYSFDTDTGTYTVMLDTAAIPFETLCPAGGVATSVISAVDSFDTIDFAMQCKPGYDAAVWSIATNNRFFPARFAWMRIGAGDIAELWSTNCNTSGLGGQLVVTINGPASYYSAFGVQPDSVSGNTLIYNISDWEAVNAATAFNFTVQTDTFAQSGQQVCFTVSVTPNAGDRDTTNNTLTVCFTVVNSFDPNDKQVSPIANIDTLQEWLTYTIRFQNTGTAAAFDIYIDDTLDANLDESTFQLLSYSHEPLVQLHGNAVRFNFPNINLPDSTSNEPESHGYVQYKVKLKENMPVGTMIENTAAIYFDFNPPVITNTTVNTITVLPPPVAVITPTANSVCAGGSTTLIASGGISFQWSTGDATASVVVTPPATTAYSVTVTDEHGNTATTNATVVVKQPSAVTLNESICEGSSYFFNNEWLVASGTFTEMLVNAESCDSTVTLNLTVHDAPQPVITQTDDTLSTGTFTSYEWLRDGFAVGNMQYLQVTQNGNYSVMVTDANGCSNTSAIKTVVGVGVEGLTNDDGRWKMYPNPNNGSFTLEFSDNVEREVAVMDMVGKVIVPASPVTGRKEFQLNDITKGIYFLRVTEGERVMHVKFEVN